MKNRMSRNNQRRSSFKTNDMLFMVRGELEIKASKKDLHINFLTFEDSDLFTSLNGKPLFVTVEAKILHVSENRGKELTTPLGSGKFTVPVVPGKLTDSPGVSCRSADKFNELVIKKEQFRNFPSDFTKCVINMTAKLQDIPPTSSSQSSSSCSDSKRRRKNDSVSSGNGKEDGKQWNIHEAEMQIFNSKLDCLLSNGNYRVISSDGRGVGKLVVRVHWSDSAHSSSSVTPISSLKNTRQPLPKLTPSRNQSNTKDIKMTYRLFHNQTEYQDTTSRVGDNVFHCPWCQLNCMRLPSLRMHLKHCHHRFIFRVKCESKSSGKTDIKIEVSINDAYDGSFEGNPFAQVNTGFAFTHDGPKRRTPVTILFVNKKRKNGDPLDEDDEVDNRPLVIGHDRLYYHTNTCTPIRPQDMDIDSEDENDPQWMRLKTQQVCNTLHGGIFLD
jgi:hypothetical protein